MRSEFGLCNNCGCKLEPVWFIEKECKILGSGTYYTGRQRRACSHLYCNNCGNKVIIDDTFDEPYHYVN